MNADASFDGRRDEAHTTPDAQPSPLSDARPSSVLDSQSPSATDARSSPAPDASRANAAGDPLVAVRDLEVYFDAGNRSAWSAFAAGDSASRRVVRAVDGVSFEIRRGETLGLVGESGCGKSTVGRALLRLVPHTGGQVYFRGRELSQLPSEELRRLRRHMQMIFQDPYASLNPRMTVGQIVSEPLETFGLARRGRERMERVGELLETVGLSVRHARRYPREFSGGQRQRIGIARALAANPEFIVADEPVSALDVSIQAQIMNLLERLRRERNLTYLFISHDLRAVRHLSDRIAVMYLGKLVELGAAAQVYREPLMPYTKALISAVPFPDPEREATRRRIVLAGDVPSPLNPPPGCRFHTRCPYAVAACREVTPALAEIKPGHSAACIRISPAEPDIEAVAANAAPGLENPEQIAAS
ncbi:MAG TPA: oligopeptide/dipeptide ABC transporter ATP-binding protein [Pyrinomonadaceae bacterium]|jgi:oligopeptide transport system ATP-binding protein